MDHRRLLARAVAALSLATLLFVFFCVPLTIAQLSADASIAPAPERTLLVVEEPTAQDWAGFLQAIGSWGTLNRLGIVALATQGIMLVARSKLTDDYLPLSGKAKLSVVTGSSLVLGVIALRTSGLDWGQAMMHSTTLAALQVFGHQLAQTFLPPKNKV